MVKSLSIDLHTLCNDYPYKRGVAQRICWKPLSLSCIVNRSLYLSFLSVANDRICHEMATASSAISSCAHHHLSTTQSMQYPIVSHTNDTDTILARNGMARCSRKLRIYSPKILWLSNHSYRLGEALTQTAAERSRNGVVGSIGRNIPITPNASEMQPMTIKKILITPQKYEILPNNLYICSTNRCKNFYKLQEI